MHKILIHILLFILTLTSAEAGLFKKAYAKSACGLNFIHKSVKLRNRQPEPKGSLLPVTFRVDELPEKCYEIEAAYIWWSMSYSDSTENSNFQARIIYNSFQDTSIINAKEVQESGTKNWDSYGEEGTKSYRLDLQDIMTVNDNYKINIFAGHFNSGELDGLTLIIIYRDLQAEYEGHMILYEGIDTKRNEEYEQYLSFQNFPACDEAVTAQSIFTIADLQLADGQKDSVMMVMNGTRDTVYRKFWNSQVIETHVDSGQSGSYFALEFFPGDNDAYSVVLEGLYYQTETCRSCPDLLQFKTVEVMDEICYGDTASIYITGDEVDFFQIKADSLFDYYETDGKYIYVVPKHRKTYFDVYGYSADTCRMGWINNVLITMYNEIDPGLEDTAICAGNTLHFGKPPKGGKAPFKYYYNSEHVYIKYDSTSYEANAFFMNSATITVEVTDALGCSGYDTMSVDVGNDFSLYTSENKIVCYGEEVQLEANAYGADTNFYYQWTPETGLSDPHSNTPTITVYETTVFYVTVSNESTNCTKTDSILITVLPGPDINLGPDLLVCRDSAFMMTPIVKNATHPLTYKWVPADWLSSDSIINPIVTPGESTEYILTITDGNGCSRTDTIFIEVYPYPTIELIDTMFLCCNEEKVMEASVSDVVEPYSILWSPANGLSDPTLLRPIIKCDANNIYYMTLTDGNGCSYKDSVSIQIMKLPVFDAGPGLSVCYGDSVMLGKSFSDDIVEYKWLPENGLNNANIPYPLASPEYTTMYYIEATNYNGCKSIDSVLVEVLPLPIPDIILSGNYPPCLCDTLLLDAGEEYIGYLWQDGSSNRYYEVTEPGDYYVAVTNTSGCTNVSDTLPVDFVVPWSVISNENGDILLNPGDTAELQVSLKAGEYLDYCDIYDFTMELSYGSTILNIINKPLGSEIRNNKKYVVLGGTRREEETLLQDLKFNVDFGNAPYSEIRVEKFVWEKCTGVVEIINGSRIIINDAFYTDSLSCGLYIIPNPASDIAEIHYHLNENNSYNIQLIDMLGREYELLKKGNTESGFYIFYFDVAAFSQGRYFIQLQTNNCTITKPLIILK